MGAARCSRPRDVCPCVGAGEGAPWLSNDNTFFQGVLRIRCVGAWACAYVPQHLKQYRDFLLGTALFISQRRSDVGVLLSSRIRAGMSTGVVSSDGWERVDVSTDPPIPVSNDVRICPCNGSTYSKFLVLGTVGTPAHRYPSARLDPAHRFPKVDRRSGRANPALFIAQKKHLKNHQRLSHCSGKTIPRTVSSLCFSTHACGNRSGSVHLTI